MAAPRRNVELKVRDGDPDATLTRALGLDGVEDRGVLEQRDTYFHARKGRLKLREQQPGSAYLIAYERPDAAVARTSTYRLAQIDDADTLKAALDAALGTVTVVTKRRRLLLWRNVRIHLDDVEGLGRFVELEAVAAPEAEDLTDDHAAIAHLTEALELGEPVATSYADLLLYAPQALLAAAAAAMRHAYAPYSQLRVGAALRAPSGSIHAAANVENAAFPEGQCAEASALGALVAAGEQQISAVAVVCDKLDVCPPCGGCRQRLSELGGPDVPVYLGRPGAVLHTTTLGELLPLAFDEGAIG